MGLHPSISSRVYKDIRSPLYVNSDRDYDESFERELEKIIQRTKEMEYRLAKIIYNHRKTEEKEGQDYE